ncbi:hypothetical protein H114_03416 [Streptomyces gancidicus BKS 13-15]|uniref:Uncharacterized protein n=1 Tax=Streptomyces gancidicus BKS 13-15 TaxID=1284664 RepID=M3E9S4_STREZ|nr:hypothetical protein H114_03416 [Streptomyces gancidicus BKS 13-15]
MRGGKTAGAVCTAAMNEAAVPGLTSGGICLSDSCSTMIAVRPTFRPALMTLIPKRSLITMGGRLATASTPDGR